MKLVPVFTEKSTGFAKQGKYTFAVDVKATKNQVRAELLKIFGVHAKEVRTIKNVGESKRNLRGQKVWVRASKKAIVTIAEGEKLDVFEEKKK